jgi:hypothetical protein
MGRGLLIGLLLLLGGCADADVKLRHLGTPEGAHKLFRVMPLERTSDFDLRVAALEHNPAISQDGFARTRYPAGFWRMSGMNGWDADRVNDGDLIVQAFNTEGVQIGPWIMIDLGADHARAFTRLELTPRAAGGVPGQSNDARFDIQYSDVGDAGPWTTVYNGFSPFVTTADIPQPTVAVWNNQGNHRFWRIMKTNLYQSASTVYFAELQWVESPATRSGGLFNPLGPAPPLRTLVDWQRTRENKEPRGPSG